MVRAKTINEYLDEANKYLMDVGNVPIYPLNDEQTGKTYQPIAAVLSEITRWEKIPNRVSPVTQRMLRQLHQQMQNTHEDSKQRSFFDWGVVALSMGYRKCEWAVDVAPKSIKDYPKHYADQNGDKGYYNCIGDDWRFLDGNGIAIPTENEDAISGSDFAAAETTIRFQKNGRNGEKQNFAKNTVNPMFCVPSAVMRIKQRARRMGMQGTEPLAVYKAQAGSKRPSFFSNQTIIPLLQAMARATYGITDLKAAGLRYTGHSFRVGAAVLMHSNGATEVEIQQRLRWASDTYKLYLRKMPQNAIRHMRMFNTGDVDSWEVDNVTFATGPLTTQ
jgi:hypothetical protein